MDISVVDPGTLEFYIATVGVGVGFLLGVACSTNKLMRLSRRLTFSIGVAALGFITHGVHHYIIGDDFMGPLSDLLLDFGALGIIFELYYMQWRAAHPRTPKT